MSHLTALSLTRRELLRLGAAAFVAPIAFAPRRMEPWRFAVCSDTHFGVPDALETNRALFAEMARHSPQLAFIAGDVTERAWSAEYDDLDRATDRLPFPVHGAPGNHDVRWAPLGLQGFSTRVGPPHRVIRHGGCAWTARCRCRTGGTSADRSGGGWPTSWRASAPTRRSSSSCTTRPDAIPSP
jgi:hypothetical protein